MVACKNQSQLVTLSSVHIFNLLEVWLVNKKLHFIFNSFTGSHGKFKTKFSNFNHAFIVVKRGNTRTNIFWAVLFLYFLFRPIDVWKSHCFQSEIKCNFVGASQTALELAECPTETVNICIVFRV